ncbi:MAG: metal-dependent hydrolase, partial [Candidatus Angelobacter sp.]
MNLNEIKITWLGHATFLVVTPGGKNIILDPWVSGNPKTPADKKSFDKLDYMLISHGHSDHFADAVDLAKKHNPKVVSIYELCTFVQQKGAKQIAPMNKGGTQQVGDIKVTMVNAHHSNTIDDGGASVPGGEPCGYVIEFENGLKLYHAGDTCVFGDMAIIRELYAPD